ncbi:hypothetical protein ACIQZG_22180 [Lysinibacillus sp. NPDC096418]|uniref:hypothetical protein n=1 Tax=Lysinibacillus sp. NPDC096418 TaxID=3364138 RepID=UPI00382A2BC4
MKKLGNNFVNKKSIGETVDMTKEVDKFAPRRIFPEDHEALRKLAFDKKLSYVELLNEIHEFSKIKMHEKGLEYYREFEKYNTPSAQHKSLGLPQEFNAFLNEFSTRDFPAKHLLSAIIQDYIINQNK